MNDAELIEKLQTAFEYELINGHVYKPNVAAVKAVINLVREYDKPSIEEHIRREFDVIQNQTIEACLEAVDADLIIDDLRNRKGFRRWWDNCDFQDDVINCLNNRIEKAIR